jgi:hypothetical protein
MRRLAFGFVLLAFPIFSSSVMAFDLDKNTVTTPDSTSRLADPDEAPLPAPLPSLHIQDDGTSVQSAPGAGLQIAPGTSLQITGGSGSQISPAIGLQISPTEGNSGNPADNKALIPSP